MTLLFGRGLAPAGAVRPCPALRRLMPALQAPDAWSMAVEPDKAPDLARSLSAWGWITESGLDRAEVARRGA